MFRRLLPAVRQSAKVVQHRNLWDLSLHRDPRHIIRDVERRMRDLERDFFGNSFFPLRPSRLMPIQGIPAQKFLVDLDVSGFKPEDIKISVKDKVLRIEASLDEKGKDGSRWQQSFVKEVTIPENLDVATVESFLHHDGTLRIEGDFLKQKGEEEVKKIPIEKDEKLASKSKL